MTRTVVGTGANLYGDAQKPNLKGGADQRTIFQRKSLWPPRRDPGRHRASERPLGARIKLVWYKLYESDRSAEGAGLYVTERE
jgi:hypothetical protein